MQNGLICYEKGCDLTMNKKAAFTKTPARRIAYTLAGIVLSFTIAVGGWALTSRLIDTESDRLLSAVTYFSVDMPAAEPLSMVEEDDEANISFGLTDDEIVSILQNWELTHYRRPHEPAAGQIDMNTAVISARSGINFLVEQNILPTEAARFESTGAFLSQNVPRGEVQFLPLRYSYWTVFFSNDNLSINMTINAVTGQIWEIVITARHWRTLESVVPFPLMVSRDDIENTLSAFMSGLDLQPVDGTVHGLLHSFDFEFDEYGNARLPIVDYDSGTPTVIPPTNYIETQRLRRYIELPPPGLGLIIDEATLELFRWLWHFENGLMIGQSFVEGGARAEIMAGGALPGGVLYFDRLHIRLTTSPPPESWFMPPEFW